MSHYHTEEEAKELFEKHRNFWEDPFPEIPPSLLSTFHIRKYVKETGMLYPFSDADCKTATVMGKVGGDYKYWDDPDNFQSGILGIKEGVGHIRSITLKPNSIAFVPIDLVFQLPDYIAARFNLMIDFVYKGLLLGTAPLVGPGYNGKIWIPLHNLTSRYCPINVSDELIRIEFTKLSCPSKTEIDNDSDYIHHRPKSRTTLESMLGNNVIISSIPDAMKISQDAAKNAEKSVKRQWWIGGGVIFTALISIVIAIILGVWQLHRESVEIRQMIHDNTVKIETVDSTVSGNLNVNIDSKATTKMQNVTENHDGMTDLSDDTNQK